MEVNCIYPKILEYFNNDLVPAGLMAQLVERCTGIAEVKGLNPVQFLFSGFLFAAAKVASITAMIISSSPRS